MFTLLWSSKRGPCVICDTSVGPIDFSYYYCPSTDRPTLIPWQTFRPWPRAFQFLNIIGVDDSRPRSRTPIGIITRHMFHWSHRSHWSHLPWKATNATNVTHKYFNMAEKKADAPAAGMLWGGRFTGSNVSGNKLRMQFTDLTVRRRDWSSHA